MHFTTLELTALVGAYLWPFFRIAAMLMAMPLIGVKTVSSRIRISLAIVITLLVAPMVPDVPAVEPLSLEAIFIVLQQVLIGITMGFILHLVFAIFLLGAHVISMQMGLGFATMIDPQSGASIPVLGQFFTIIVTLVFLSFNGHLLMIEMVVNSFHTLPISDSGIAVEGYKQVADWGREVFSGAVLVALPAIAALLFVTMTLGVMTRAAPQFNIFAVGFPISLIWGMVIVYFLLPGLVGQIDDLFMNGFALISRLLGGA